MEKMINYLCSITCTQSVIALFVSKNTKYDRCFEFVEFNHADAMRCFLKSSKIRMIWWDTDNKDLHKAVERMLIEEKI
jgi:hypothetical protein